MSNDLSQHLDLEEFAQIPEWAKSQARDPKVTRALVSTSTSRSKLLRSLLLPSHLIHCYTKPGFGVDPWLTRLLATLPAELTPVDIGKIIQNNNLENATAVLKFLSQVEAQSLAYGTFNARFVDTSDAVVSSNISNKAQHMVILIRLDRLERTLVQEVISGLATLPFTHTVIINSTRSPEAWLANAESTHRIVHLGESQLNYSLEDYEKLTSRWPTKPSQHLILQFFQLFNAWPEPCLRSLCEFTDLGFVNAIEDNSEPNQWLAGHQWISTFVYNLPLDLLQILLTAHTQPILTPEGLDIYDPNPNPNAPKQVQNSLEATFYDEGRRQRSAALTLLCNALILEQFSHPKLHFRWSSACIQTVLKYIAQKDHQIAHLQLRVPQQFAGLNVQLCELYLEHDYIQEIIQLCLASNDSKGLELLMAQQPGRVIDYLRGTSSHLETLAPALEQSQVLTNTNSKNLQSYLKKAFYWCDSNPTASDTNSTLDTPSLAGHSNDQSHSTDSIIHLIDQFCQSRNALATGELAEGLVKLEQVFLSAVDDRCFSVAAPSMALIGLIDFFCMNKRHLRKILQALDHAEPLSDPLTHISLVDWMDICISPLQILSTHGNAITKRLTARSQQDFKGQMPEEATLFLSWIMSLAALYGGNPRDSQLICTGTLNRLMANYCHHQESHKKTSVATTGINTNLSSSQINYALDLLRPWVSAFSLVKLLSDLQTRGKSSAKEGQVLLKYIEPYLLMTQNMPERKDIWHVLMLIISLFLQTMESTNHEKLQRLEQEVLEAKHLKFRLIWTFGSLLLSAALWNAEQEELALQHFYGAIEFAQTHDLQEILTPLIDLLHPQIRRAKQKNKAILLIAKALEILDRKNHQKNNLLEQLSKRELEILAFINQGMSNEDIADHLCRAKGTVKLHVHNIYKKLQIRNRVEAIQIYNRYTCGV